MSPNVNSRDLPAGTHTPTLLRSAAGPDNSRWVEPGKSGDFEVYYGVPVGRRKIEYRPPEGMPRFATIGVTDGRETAVTIRLP